jgi:hypothetical protein
MRWVRGYFLMNKIPRGMAANLNPKLVIRNDLK